MRSAATSVPAFICAPTSALIPEMGRKAPSLISSCAPVRAGVPTSTAEPSRSEANPMTVRLRILTPPRSGASVILDVQFADDSTRIPLGWATRAGSGRGRAEGLFSELPSAVRPRGTHMRAWTVDADDIRVADDFDESLLHRTPEIDSFLTPDRDDKFIVIATKGFGKTLLLKAKRILYQRESRPGCLPSGNLLDKPIGDKIFGREALAFFAASPLPWSKLWLTAIAVATLKHLGQTGGLKVGQKLTALIADGHLRSVVDHFVRLLDFNPSDLQRSATDTDGRLVPLLRAVTSPVAIFIDGVDEYFNKHIEGVKASPSVTGQLSPNVWYFAQLGLVEVAYQLRRINHHLKVFAAVRKEAYSRLPQTTVMAQQYRGSAIDIIYSTESLREIFVNNIRLEKSERMVRSERRMDPIEAFLGRPKVVHTYTREEEHAFEYVCRHTLLRPRDLMTVGERLSALRPEERGQEHRF